MITPIDRTKMDRPTLLAVVGWLRERAIIAAKNAALATSPAVEANRKERAHDLMDLATEIEDGFMPPDVVDLVEPAPTSSTVHKNGGAR